MSGKRRFVDVAKDTMGKSAIGCMDLRIVFEHVAKHSQRNVRFEWKKMKERASDGKPLMLHPFASLALTFIYFHSKCTFRWLCSATYSNTILKSMQPLALSPSPP